MREGCRQAVVSGVMGHDPRPVGGLWPMACAHRECHGHAPSDPCRGPAREAFMNDTTLYLGGDEPGAGCGDGRR